MPEDGTSAVTVPPFRRSVVDVGGGEVSSVLVVMPVVSSEGGNKPDEAEDPPGVDLSATLSSFGTPRVADPPFVPLPPFGHSEVKVGTTSSSSAPVTSTFVGSVGNIDVASKPGPVSGLVTGAAVGLALRLGVEEGIAGLGGSFTSNKSPALATGFLLRLGLKIPGGLEVNIMEGVGTFAGLRVRV